MAFKYFDKPEMYVGLTPNESHCDTCGQQKFCFNATAFSGAEDLLFICPACLENGQLKGKNAFTCEGDISELKMQIKFLNPDLDAGEILILAQQKTFELEKTTPQLVTWQDWNWPCADGDYSKFIGYGSKIFYQELAKDVQVETFFKNSFYYEEQYNDELWADAVPDNLIKDYEESNKYGTLFYVFKSLNSEKIITMWDSC